MVSLTRQGNNSIQKILPLTSQDADSNVDGGSLVSLEDRVPQLSVLLDRLGLQLQAHQHPEDRIKDIAITRGTLMLSIADMQLEDAVRAVIDFLTTVQNKPSVVAFLQDPHKLQKVDLLDLTNPACVIALMYDGSGTNLNDRARRSVLEMLVGEKSLHEESSVQTLIDNFARLAQDDQKYKQLFVAFCRELLGFALELEDNELVSNEAESGRYCNYEIADQDGSAGDLELDQVFTGIGDSTRGILDAIKTIDLSFYRDLVSEIKTQLRYPPRQRRLTKREEKQSACGSLTTLKRPTIEISSTQAFEDALRALFPEINLARARKQVIKLLEGDREGKKGPPQLLPGDNDNVPPTEVTPPENLVDLSKMTF
ncbi:MAG: hypothetical protein UR28_C0016G0020 [Candidatus Peregrinibacteria bacterium GW2011_GWF2_33_10]|nr:MAG: hypothetical protein UR28_C0016G0020 [Candidatus Peregrinibacteria bacterium GW2011_GWF2_33_10]OGJ45832.1 MAG: hypothetical protein A2263_03505 [Candidatus Peregrinibacteria bacterium RIFOXYA2_FULL_33_21]OGJ46796.1 MAG: hypothetical protein A2272_06120 [Candidatus Peregrinibacteria bacterium RIFOXYA12_FULL_33_12]OGJ51377.1 MAG: hypothetical protein A2307_02395 [Candidatus Peregrinibacteria bacterium RIFOXYB2_FULL_33_20]